MNKLAFALVVWVVLVLSSPVQAASGQVTGKLHLYINQGQYCDSAVMNCTGARFLKAMNNGYQPIKEARVEIADQNGNILGISSTDNQGNYTLNWTAGSTPASAHVRWVFSHKDARFRVAPPNNMASVWYASTSSFTLVNGGVKAVGNSYFSDTIERQAYDSAHRMWDNAVKYTVVGLDSYYGVVILAEVPGFSGARFYKGPPPHIELGSGQARYPMTVHHELGHVLHYLADTGYRMTQFYNYPTRCPGNGCGTHHGFWTQEWKRMTYVEGLAGYLGLVASYWGYAPQPLWCANTELSCPLIGANTIDVELTPTCQVGDDREEGHTIRFLWDIYDTQNDGTYSDQVALTYDQTVERLTQFPAGSGNGQLNEPFDSALIGIDDEDGGSIADYRSAWGATVNPQATANCQ